MRRKCRTCAEKFPMIEEFENDQLSYKQWIVKSKCRIIKGKERIIKRTVKDSIHCYKKELILKMITLLPKVLSHCFNIQKQYDSLKTIK